MKKASSTPKAFHNTAQIHRSGTAAAKSKIRNPKLKTIPKSKYRMTKTCDCHVSERVSNFGFHILNLFRISIFVFRNSRATGVTFLIAGLFFVLPAFATTSPANAAQNNSEVAQRFLAEMATLSAAAEKRKASAIRGKDGWLFFVPELRAISVGPFWSQHAVKVSRASNRQYADPLEPIIDFHQQLKKAGIELLLMPVPAKSVIYPAKISDLLKPVPNQKPLRLDLFHKQFYERLGKQGVQVIDLVPLMNQHRNDQAGAMYCKTDTHWSGRACLLAAKLLAPKIKNRPWLKTASKNSKKRYASETRDVQITGDLARMLNEADPVRETLPLTFVGEKASGGLRPIEPWRESPVLLMGDSHTLVFHDPTLHAKGAGLADHLALTLGIPVDLIGVRGSGATTTRITLLRRRDNLKGKKLVIWCFSMREFTESFSGWRKVPVIR